MNLQSIKHNFKLGIMNLQEIEWLITMVEKQEHEYGTLMESIGEMDTTILSLMNELRQYQNQEALLLAKIQKFQQKTTWKVYEENLRLAQEIALLKGEMSG